MSKGNILIIGSAGSLGRELCKRLKEKYSIFALDVNENDLAHVFRLHSVPVFLEDFTNTNKIMDIVKNNKIDIIINCAAMKHVKSCEEDVEKAIRVNILGNINLINSIKKTRVGFIYISTDKAIKPTNVYALTKQFVDYVIKKNNYKIIRGVNFLNSKGSVLTIWDQQYINKYPFTLVKDKCVRYFVTLSEMSNIIEKSITKDGYEFYPSDIYEISIRDLFLGYLKFKNLNYEKEKIKLFSMEPHEKTKEDINFDTNIHQITDIEQISDMIRFCF